MSAYDPKNGHKRLWRGLTWLSALGSTAPIEIVDYAVIALPFTQTGIGAAAALTAGQLHGSNVQGRLGHRSSYGCRLALAIRNRHQGRLADAVHG